jgi:hypothetical protein
LWTPESFCILGLMANEEALRSISHYLALTKDILLRKSGDVYHNKPTRQTEDIEPPVVLPEISLVESIESAVAAFWGAESQRADKIFNDKRSLTRIPSKAQLVCAFSIMYSSLLLSSDIGTSGDASYESDATKHHPNFSRLLRGRIRKKDAKAFLESYIASSVSVEEMGEEEFRMENLILRRIKELHPSLYREILKSGARIEMERMGRIYTTNQHPKIDD